MKSVIKINKTDLFLYTLFLVCFGTKYLVFDKNDENNCTFTFWLLNLIDQFFISEISKVNYSSFFKLCCFELCIKFINFLHKNMLNLISLCLLIYPHTEFSQNKITLYYYHHSGHVLKIPNHFYYTYTCLYNTTLTVILRIFQIDYMVVYLNTLTMNIICIITYWPLFFIKPQLVKPIYTLEKGLETPLFTDVSMHFLPFVISLYIYLMVLKKERNKSYEIHENIEKETKTVDKKINKILLGNYLALFISIMYVLVCMYSSKYFYNAFPYSLLEKMGVFYTVGFMGVMYFFGIFIKMTIISFF